jgi:hypothetical protein
VRFLTGLAEPAGLLINLLRRLTGHEYAVR